MRPTEEAFDLGPMPNFDECADIDRATWPVGIFPFAYSANFSHGPPGRIWASSGLIVRRLLLLFTATVVLGCHLRHQARSRS
jgi:hypothetical protein